MLYTNSKEIKTKIITLAVSISIMLFIWYLIAIISNNSFLPSPQEVFKILLDLFKEKKIFIHLLVSLQRTIIGFMIALILALIVAYTLTSFSIGKYFENIIELLRPIPPIAWIPLIILFLGIGNLSSYTVIAIASFFPIFTSTYFGMVSLPSNFRYFKHLFKLKEGQYIRHVLIQYTIPYALNGAKIGIGMAWMAVIASEMIATTSGLGYFIEINRVLTKPAYVIAGIIIIGIIGFILNQLISIIEKKVVYWKND